MNQPNLSQNQPQHKPIKCADIIAQFHLMRGTLETTTTFYGMWSSLPGIRLEVARIVTPTYMPDQWWFIYDDVDYQVHISGEWHEIYAHFRPVLEVS